MTLHAKTARKIAEAAIAEHVAAEEMGIADIMLSQGNTHWQSYRDAEINYEDAKETLRNVIAEYRYLAERRTA